MTTHQLLLMSDDFPRWGEIQDYANRRGIGFSKAIIELVNKGLSHVDDSD